MTASTLAVPAADGSDIGEARPRAPRFALWQLGFRPFFLFASVFAALSIGLWALQFAGWLGRPYLQGPLWHAHEMLFGFALAVVVGFLLTAGKTWANRPTLSGVPLAALVLLWLAGRVLVLTPFAVAAAIVNVAFPLAAALALAVPFMASRNRRNYFFVALLLLVAVAELAVHLAQLGLVDVPARIGIQVGLDILLFVMAVMAGRVIPLFTNSGVPGAGARKHVAVERLALGAVLALLIADAAQLDGALLMAIAGVGASAHLVRLTLWRPWTTLRVPLVWALHVAYAWIPVHLALRALAEAGFVAPSVATHALTAGAAGGLIIAMMTRTSRGHTGRPLRADGVDVACYLLVLAAASIRVFVPLVDAMLTTGAVLLSAALWSAGFALFAIRYGPMLVRARIDGRPG